jgi:hypothetical protein
MSAGGPAHGMLQSALAIESAGWSALSAHTHRERRVGASAVSTNGLNGQSVVPLAITRNSCNIAK